jgi:hypothetical protein
MRCLTQPSQPSQPWQPSQPSGRQGRGGVACGQATPATVELVTRGEHGLIVMGSRSRGNVRSLLSGNAVICWATASWPVTHSDCRSDRKGLQDGGEATTLEIREPARTPDGYRPQGRFAEVTRGRRGVGLASDRSLASRVERHDGRGS